MLITIWIKGMPNGFTRHIDRIKDIEAFVDQWGIERIYRITISDIGSPAEFYEDIPVLNLAD